MSISSIRLFLHDFFSALQRNGIACCILRNADEVAAGTAHDIDMTVDSSRLEEAEVILSDIAASHGWNLHLKTGRITDQHNIKCYNYFLLDEDAQEISIVHIDIFPTFSWHGYELLSNQALLDNRQENELYPAAAKETEAVCNLFTRLLYNGYVKDKYKPEIRQSLLRQPQKFRELTRHFLPHELSERICRLATDEQWSRIEEERSNIIDGIKRTARHFHLAHWRYLLNKALHRKGLIVAFMGTDGSGKSTIIDGLPTIIGNTFSGSTIDYYHWRPGFIHPEKKLTKEGEVVSHVQPHTREPMGRLASFAKMVFYTLDYTLGFIGRVYWQAAKGHLVIFDRYYYDFYVDKIRYRLSVSNAVIRLFQLFIPRPDVTFLLVGDAQQIYERKKELPLEEVQAQIDTLLRHQKHFANPVVTDVSQSIPRVLYCVSRDILQNLHKRA